MSSQAEMPGLPAFPWNPEDLQQPHPGEGGGGWIAGICACPHLTHPKVG